MTTKAKRWRIVLVMALSIIVVVIAYRVYQDEKAREAKRIDMIGAVDPETLAASKKPVTKLHVGVTYIAYSKTEWSDYAWMYFKLLPGERVLCVSDYAHYPRSFYYRRYRQGDDDSKWINIYECEYTIKGKNYFSEAGMFARIYFDVKENVKKGSHGEPGWKEKRWGGAGALEFKDGHYRANTFRLDGNRGDLYEAKAQLPNSLDEYVKQYKMSSDLRVISGNGDS
ncbi:MAG: hypothetical protein LKI92_08595 [Schleiferilactobacillus harbinensis]|jgi:hypothetical protein|nr:hypothetical protein [Schleiferilactobacillus harbinensis]